MASNIEFIQERAIATRAAQASLAATWVWDEKTLAQWDTDLSLLAILIESEQDTEAEMLAMRGDTDTALEILQSLTARCLRMAKNRYRDDAARMAVFQHLRSESGSRSGKLQEALEWESGWEKTEPAWVPLPGVLLAEFKTRRLAAAALVESYAGRRTAWEATAAALSSQAHELNADCVAWYEAACTVFPEATPEGQMIRSTVPTTYQPPSQSPTALLLASLIPGANGQLTVHYVPGGGVRATSLRLEIMSGVPAGALVINLPAIPPTQLISDLPTGVPLTVRALASNVAGTTASPALQVQLPAV